MTTILISTKSKFEADIESRLDNFKARISKLRIFIIKFEAKIGISDENIRCLFSDLVDILKADAGLIIEYQILDNFSAKELSKVQFQNSDPSSKMLLDVWYLPAQTDNVAKTLKFLLKYCANSKNFGEIKLEANTVTRYSFDTELPINSLDKIKSLLRINDLLQMYSFVKTGGEILESTMIDDSLDDSNKNTESIQDYDFRKISLQEFKEIGNCLGLGLKSQDLDVIRNYYLQMGKVMSRLELETYAQTWSEHCKHRIFSASIDEIEDGLYKHYIKRATKEIRAKKAKKDFCASVFSDNSGAIHFDEEYLITAKVETHNSPSALDPFGGAITGILGVNRDCLGFGLGAKPIANTYAFCFPNPNYSEKYFRAEGKKSPLLSPEYIIEGVISGIEAGGNESGIPTVHGKILFDDSYIAKPLVFAGTIGIIPKSIGNQPSIDRKPNDGDLVLILGGRTGRDGIHGAIISSEELNQSHNYTHVQIGDPITQKKVLDMVLQMRDLGLISAITDNGAGGFSSSIGELGSSGFVVDLSKVLIKAPGILPHEIWISESQERMTLAISPSNLEEIQRLAKKHDVEFQILGNFNSTGFGKVHFKEGDIEKVVEIDLELLHNGAPKLRLKTAKTFERPLTEEEMLDIISEGPMARFFGKISDSFSIPFDSVLPKDIEDCKEEELLIKVIAKLCDLVSPELAVKTAHRFDYSVQGRTFIPPILGDNFEIVLDTSVIIPNRLTKQGLAITSAAFPEYGVHMASNAIDTVVRNLVVAGANPEKIALLDNFCWSDSTNPESLALLKKTAEECYEFAVLFGTPFISGKDSMFNDFKGFDSSEKFVHLKSNPTLLITGIGIIDDISVCTTPQSRKKPTNSQIGDLILIIGETYPHMGGSAYYNYLGFKGGLLPMVNKETALENYQAFYQILTEGYVKSAISIQKGGIAIAGMQLNCVSGLVHNIRLEDIPIESCEKKSQINFSESPSRIILTIAPKDLKIVQNILTNFGVIFAEIGVIEGEIV